MVTPWAVKNIGQPVDFLQDFVDVLGYTCTCGCDNARRKRKTRNGFIFLGQQTPIFHTQFYPFPRVDLVGC